MLFDLIALGKWDTGIYTLQKAPLSQAVEKIKQLGSGELDVVRVLLEPGD